MVRNILSGCIIGMVMVFSLSGCVSNAQYRTSYSLCNTAAEANCTKASLEDHQDYLLGFVEFDDQGWFWDRRQMWALVDTLQNKEALESGLVMIVYVHGWQHNAAYGDGNVTSFRNTLSRIHDLEELASREENRPPRKIAGVYVGWRGQSVNLQPFTGMTFWDRKNTADKVGHGALSELLLQLENVQISHLDVYDRPESKAAKTKLIVVGHSFGGQMVYSALSQILFDRFVGSQELPPQTFGDLVVLVNPAFEASRFTPMRETATERRWYPVGQLPLVAIFTSENDYATKYAFPTGRWFSTFFESTRNAEQKWANRETVGHFEPYITHRLIRTHGAGEENPLQPTDLELKGGLEAAKADMKLSKSIKGQWKDISSKNNWTLDFTGSQLRHLGKSQPLNPLYVVSVDKEIIDGHGGIWGPVFVDFMRQFILFSTIVSDN